MVFRLGEVGPILGHFKRGFVALQREGDGVVHLVHDIRAGIRPVVVRHELWQVRVEILERENVAIAVGGRIA